MEGWSFAFGFFFILGFMAVQNLTVQVQVCFKNGNNPSLQVSAALRESVGRLRAGWVCTGQDLWRGQVAPSKEGEGVTQVSVSPKKGLKKGPKPATLT